MNSSINFASQKISFVNKINILQKALSNDETPTPSYLYKEINDISYESVGYCESLVEFVVDRLRHPSCHVKLKVLKVMKHVVENGSKEVQLGLKQHVSFIKECIKFSGPPHPVHGNTPYLMVRNSALDLCEILYNLDPLSLKSTSKSVEDVQTPPVKYGGMGPFRSGGAIQGFGNSPMSQSKGFAGTILHEIEKLGTKLSETTVDRQNAVLARLNLSGSSSNYQPPVVTPESIEGFTHQESREVSPGLDLNTEKTVPRHFPGKAGGGWNDDDDDEYEGSDAELDDLNSDKDHQALQENQESEESADRQEHQELISDEKMLLEDMMIQEPTSSAQGIKYLSNSDIAHFLEKCCKLRCAIVLDCICDNLVHRDPVIVARSLQLLEGIVFNQEELINIDSLAVKCKSDLVACFTKAGEEISTVSNSDTKDCYASWRAVQTKAAKVILILHQLSSHKDIIPSSQIVNELARSASLMTPVM